VYLRNCPAYLETVAALFKARLTHVNVNYRYKADELAYLLDNSDAVTLVYASEFAAEAAGLRDRGVGVRHWIEVTDAGTAPVNAFADSCEALASAGEAAPLGLERSPDDLVFIYTGGTTGLPKGVMWRHEDLWATLGGGGNPVAGIPPASDLDELLARIAAAPARPRQMPLSPLMHGAGLMTALMSLTQGGSVVTLEGRRFDPREALETIARERVTTVSLVGDAFARPMAEALDAAPGSFDLGSLQVVVSTGVMWSPDVKKRWLAHAPHLMLMDALGSSEGTGFGAAVTTAGTEPAPATFRIGPLCKVFREDLREVRPGSGETGYIARAGAVPVGYYKDPEKSARTFPVIDGVRYSMPGDLCRVEADGTLVLLGRGNLCINTGGEKVFVEEVEEALKTHPAVRDALVVGLPDAQWGQSVNAVVELADGAVCDEAALRDHVRARLADYKAPKRIVPGDEPLRAANGKADYGAARRALGAA
jgi:fatty-acyl-CoA synthase